MHAEQPQDHKQDRSCLPVCRISWSVPSRVHTVEHTPPPALGSVCGDWSCQPLQCCWQAICTRGGGAVLHCVQCFGAAVPKFQPRAGQQPPTWSVLVTQSKPAGTNASRLLRPLLAAARAEVVPKSTGEPAGAAGSREG